MIALLTDFGTQDWFVPVMKGVANQINPAEHVVDLTHHVRPQNVREASFVLWNAFPYFPVHTVFVCVVDPGVGSNRDIIAVQTQQHIFVAPDNGLLDLVLAEEKALETINVTNREYFLNDISQTFHGRDIFAPVGAYLSKGIAITDLGAPQTPSALKQTGFQPVANNMLESGKSHITGRVLYVDHFGNLITNIKLQADIERARVSINNFQIHGLAHSYADVEPGKALAIRGSSGLLEISIRNGSAADRLRSGFESIVEFVIDEC